MIDSWVSLIRSQFMILGFLVVNAFVLTVLLLMKLLLMKVVLFCGKKNNKE